MSEILKVNSLQKTYFSGSKELTVLKGISFTVQKGQIFSIMAHQEVVRLPY